MSIRSLFVEMISNYDNMQLQKMKSSQNTASGYVELKMDILTYDNDQTSKNHLLQDMSKIQCIKEITSTTLTKKIER